ncbi:hypothetical protein MY4824_002379 [Beauveria thailandica]
MTFFGGQGIEDSYDECGQLVPTHPSLYAVSACAKRGQTMPTHSASDVMAQVVWLHAVRIVVDPFRNMPKSGLQCDVASNDAFATLTASPSNDVASLAALQLVDFFMYSFFRCLINSAMRSLQAFGCVEWKQ